MALTKEQVQALGITRPASQTPDWIEEAQTRASARNPRQLWPNGIIPYVISREIGITLLSLLYFRTDSFHCVTKTHF